MPTFNEICDNLKLVDDIKLKNRFQSPWMRFEAALAVKCVKSLSYDEAYLAWLLILKLRPKVFVEIGGQHGHSGIIFSHAMKLVGGTFISIELGKHSSNKYPDAVCGTLEFLPNEDHVVKIWGDAELLLPEILKKYEVEMVFHDAAHTWEHVENCLNIIKNHNPEITQSCHDCKTGLWNPDIETLYGVICAERPVFDKHFLKNDKYYYDVLEDKWGFGFSVPKTKLI